MSSSDQTATGDPGTCRACGGQLVWRPEHGVYGVQGGAHEGRDCAQAPTRNHRPEKGASLDVESVVRIVRVTGPGPDDCHATDVPAERYSDVMAAIMAAYDDVTTGDVELALVDYRNRLGEWHTVTIRWETLVIDMREKARGAVVVMRDPAFS